MENLVFFYFEKQSYLSFRKKSLAVGNTKNAFIEGLKLDKQILCYHFLRLIATSVATLGLTPMGIFNQNDLNFKNSHAWKKFANT